MPNTWSIALGEEVASKVTKGSSPKWQGFDYQSDGVLFVTSENVRDGYLDVTSPKYLPPEFSLKQKNSILKVDDILINIVGASIGRSCKFVGITSPANVNQAVCVFRSRPEVSSDFILASFQSSKGVDRLLSSQAESARPNVSLSDIRKFDITLPPLPEQESIAEVLSSWDRGIRKLEAKLASKQRIKKGLMQELLSGHPRVPGFGREWGIQDGACSIPEEWNTVKLGDIGTFSKGSGASKAELSPAGSPCLRYGEIYTSQDFVLSKFRSFINKQAAANSKRMKANDLLFAGSGETREDIGKSIAYMQNDEEAYAGGDIVILSVDSNESRADYLSYYLNTIGRKQLNRLGQGQSVVHIYAKGLAKVDLTLPPIEEQQAIVKILNAADRELDALERKLSNWKAQKKYLLNNLVDGTIRLPQFISAEAS